MELTLTQLEQAIVAAQTEGAQYFGIQVTVPTCDIPEIIINHRDNFAYKLDFYKKAYNEVLEHNHSSQIKIINFTYGDTLAEIARNFKEA